MDELGAPLNGQTKEQAREWLEGLRGAPTQEGNVIPANASRMIDITERMHREAEEVARDRRERIHRLAQVLQWCMEGGSNGSYAAQQINELARDMGANIDVTSMSVGMAPFYLFAVVAAYVTEN
jgi:hypothetical protein